MQMSKHYAALKRTTQIGTIITALILGAVGCSDFEGPRINQVEEESVLTRVVINTEAVIMKLGDSITLGARLFSINGVEMTGVDASKIQWSSSSPVDATVDSSGKVRARRVINDPVQIVAKLQHNGVTKADTIPLYITETSYTASEVRVVALDSNRIDAVSYFFEPRVRIDIYDNNELVIKGARIHIESTVPGLTLHYAGPGGDLGDAIFTVRNTPAFIGSFYVKVKGNLYGAEVADSVEFIGLYPSNTGITVVYDTISKQYTFSPEIPKISPRLQPCGYVLISVYNAPEPVDIIFSDSSSATLECDPNAPLLYSFFYPDPEQVPHLIGGNLLNTQVLPYGSAYQAQRRSGSIGIVDVNIRLSGSKKIVGETFKLDVRTPDQ